jgi:UDP-N-acetylmuramoyl-L-alanyl-D-glutamate--2,6-diaminopimelate ligase
VNIDDPAGAAVSEVAVCRVVTFGLSQGADVTARDISFSIRGISGTIVTPAGDIGFSSKLLGRFNLYNILAACAVGVALELPAEVIKAGIEGHRKIAGRLEPVENDLGVTVLVDYAHTGDALENVLKTLVDLDGRRIITVFGCGGDRDRGKRPIMGAISLRYSDLTVITSDNPRTEDPSSIIAEILAGVEQLGSRRYDRSEITKEFTGKGYLVEESRREAIRLAVHLAEPGDIVLLAGKGHEDYQIIGKVKHHFDDREEAAAALRELTGRPA